jgi:carbon storage regulator CsrA
MLVLSRKNRESVVVGSGSDLLRLLKVTVLEIAGGKVKLGFEADAGIPVHRLEVWERMRASGELDGSKVDLEIPHARTG